MNRCDGSLPGICGSFEREDAAAHAVNALCALRTQDAASQVLARAGRLRFAVRCTIRALGQLPPAGRLVGREAPKRTWARPLRQASALPFFRLTANQSRPSSNTGAEDDLFSPMLFLSDFWQSAVSDRATSIPMPLGPPCGM